MNKNETIKILNKKIDEMIINGQQGTDEYKRLCRLHYILTHN